MELHLKDPDARVSYSIDWGVAYLGPLLIAGSSWTVAPDEPGGLTIEATSHAAGQTGALVAGGARGRVYRLANRVTLSDGSIDERSLTLRVEDR